MSRLSGRSFLMIDHALDYLCSGKRSAQKKRQAVLKRLGELHHQSGPPLTYDELSSAILKVFPEFDEQVLRRAAQLNRPNLLAKLAQHGLGAVIGVGAIALSLWAVNLPHPFIRQPLSKAAPILLMPSFRQMDYHYRQAAAHRAQAAKLIQEATHVNDIAKISNQTAQAQTHLAHIPDWVLDQYPQHYCSLFHCNWQFSQTEFDAAQTQLKQLQTQLKQEKIALSQWQTATLSVETAQHRYEVMQTSNDKLAALTDLKASLEKLSTIPKNTLAGKIAQAELATFQQNYSGLTGQGSPANQPHPALQVAKQYAAQAAKVADNPPLTVDTWENAATLWQTAITQLEQVPDQSPSAVDAKTLRVNYLNNLQQIQAKQTLEQTATQTLGQVRDQAQRLIEKSNTPPTPALLTELKTVMGQLQAVPPGTTAYTEAQQMLAQIEQQFRDRQATVKPQNPGQG
ncbi:MAG: hypothetical protein AAFV72_12945 [Cyanobacteria bacterium J06635_1]